MTQFTGEACASGGGHDDLFERVYRRYHARVSAFIARQVRQGDRDLVEDFAQETFLSAWRSLHTVKADEDHMFAWLATIATRVVAGHYRRKRVSELPVADDGHVWVLAALDAASVEQDRPTVAIEALAGLSAEQRAVIELGVANGMPVSAVAAETSLSAHAVRRVTAQALTHLRAVAI